MNNLLKAANALLQKHEYAAAATTFGYIVSIHPELEEAWFGQAGALLLLDSSADSLRILEQAIQNFPNNQDAWILRAQALLKLDRNDEALACIHAYPGPQDVAVTFYLGAALAAVNRYPEAVQAFRRALNMDPTLEPAWTACGEALRMMGRHEEGLSAFESALTLNPRNAKAWYLKAMACVRLSRGHSVFPALLRARVLGSSQATLLWRQCFEFPRFDPDDNSDKMSPDYSWCAQIIHTLLLRMCRYGQD